MVFGPERTKELFYTLSMDEEQVAADLTTFVSVCVAMVLVLQSAFVMKVNARKLL